MEEKDKIIKQNILSREVILEVILISIVISLGTNLIANSLWDLNKITNIFFFIIGTLIVIISSSMLIYKNFKKFSRSVTFKGFIIYDEKRNKLIDVDRYDLSYHISNYLKAAFNEDKSLKIIWKKVPLKKVFKHLLEKNKEYKTSAKEIISEVFEYIILDILSTTLTDFFNREGFDEKNLTEYKRQDIPDVLLHNRFLNLFSKPMNQREAFVKDLLKKETRVKDLLKNSGKNYEITMSTGRGGALYSKFDLVLPKNTRIKRIEKNKILLESDKIKLEFEITFDGLCTILPHDFQSLYIGLKFEPTRYHVYRLVLDLDIKFKFKSFFSSSGWKYYEWLDKYLNELEECISMEYFFKSLNWKNIRALIHTMNVKKKKSK